MLLVCLHKESLQRKGHSQRKETIPLGCRSGCLFLNFLDAFFSLGFSIEPHGTTFSWDAFLQVSLSLVIPFTTESWRLILPILFLKTMSFDVSFLNSFWSRYLTHSWRSCLDIPFSVDDVCVCLFVRFTEKGSNRAQMAQNQPQILICENSETLPGPTEIHKSLSILLKAAPTLQSKPQRFRIYQQSTQILEFWELNLPQPQQHGTKKHWTQGRHRFGTAANMSNIHRT